MKLEVMKLAWTYTAVSAGHLLERQEMHAD